AAWLLDGHIAKSRISPMDRKHSKKRADENCESALGSVSGPHRRHYQPFAMASTLSAPRAIAELQLPRKADAHLTQSPAIAIDSNIFGRQSVVRVDKCVDHFLRSNRNGSRRI